LTSLDAPLKTLTVTIHRFNFSNIPNSFYFVLTPLKQTGAARKDNLGSFP
jgi:hypothetical protein